MGHRAAPKRLDSHEFSAIVLPDMRHYSVSLNRLLVQIMGEEKIIGYRFIHNRETGEIATEPSPVYAEDWPYGFLAPNQALLRYMDYWKFEDLVKTNELYFCRADKFDDPLEGALSREGVHGTSRSDVAFAATASVNSGSYEQKAEYRDIAKGCTFVNCWHINTDESQDMWDAYTTSPDSVMIISSSERLAASLSQPVVAAAVKYVDQETPRTEFGERSLFFYKDTEYAFEREFRLLIDLMMLGGSISRDDKADFFRRVPVNLEALVGGLKLHPDATEDTFNKVRGLVEGHLPFLGESDSENKRGPIG